MDIHVTCGRPEDGPKADPLGIGGPPGDHQAGGVLDPTERLRPVAGGR